MYVFSILAGDRQTCTPVKQDQHGPNRRFCVKECLAGNLVGTGHEFFRLVSFGQTIEGLSSLIIIGIEFFWKKLIILF